MIFKALYQLSRLLFKNNSPKSTLSLYEREWCRCVHASARVETQAGWLELALSGYGGF